jgi:hypothetical protein
MMFDMLDFDRTLHLIHILVIHVLREKETRRNEIITITRCNDDTKTYFAVWILRRE